MGKGKTTNPAIVEVDKSALAEQLSKITGLTPEQVQHMAENGVPNDVFVVQTYYRITGQAAQAVIEAFKEAKE